MHSLATRVHLLHAAPATKAYRSARPDSSSPPWATYSPPLPSRLHLLAVSLQSSQARRARQHHARLSLYGRITYHPPRLIPCQEPYRCSDVPACAFGFEDAAVFAGGARGVGHAGGVHHGGVDHAGADAVYADAGRAVVDGCQNSG